MYADNYRIGKNLEMEIYRKIVSAFAKSGKCEAADDLAEAPTTTLVVCFPRCTLSIDYFMFDVNDS